MADKKLRIIKKYPNRRLYDTETSKYITLTHVMDFIRQGIDFKVLDSQSKEDVTRSVLIQLIMEQENGDSPLFTNKMLENFILYCDDTTRSVFSEFIEKNFQIFDEQQRFFKENMDNLSKVNPLKTMTDLAQKNIDMWANMQKNFMDDISETINKTDDE